MSKTKRIPSDKAETALERIALRWLNAQGADYEDGAAGAYKDLMRGGCASGIVSSNPQLVYYTDIVKFYKRHREEIDSMLKELCDDCGCTPGDLFKKAGWDDDDFFAREDVNRNILAWFGFEEAAKRVMERFKPEIA